MREKLEAIAQSATDETPPEEVIAKLEALHEEVSDDDDLRAEFEREVLKVAQGIYIPHILWIYLSAFLEDRETYRPFLEYILQFYAQQPLNPFVDKRIRPLLCIYLSEESTFYIDRLKALLERYALPEKREFFDEVQAYIRRNPTTVRIFRDKFRLLKDYFPSFDLFSLPLPHLRQQLSQNASSV